LTKTTARLAAAALLLAASAPAAPLAPESPGGRRPEYEASERVMGRAGILEPLADLEQRWQYERLRPFKALSLGSYARVHPNLKLGLFYRVQSGTRHDDDWFQPAPGAWAWRDTTNRPENVLVLDATPRVKLGARWTAALKMRYERNFFNNQSTLKLEPEVAWFWMDGLRPRATVFARHESYIPLNFGEASYYERWWYLAALWHASPAVSFGPSVALRDELWSSSADYKSALPGGSYRTLYRSVMWGAALIVRP
jgi:hypothetical protein